MNGRRSSLRDRVIAVVLVAFAIGVLFGVSVTNAERNRSASGPDRIGIWQLYLVAVIVIVLLGSGLVVAARVVVRSLSDQLAALSATVRRLGPQNMGQRIGRGADTGRELGEVADAVDGMLDRVAAGFEGQRRFASNASHELRTPLAVQRTLIEVAMATGRPDAELARLAAELLLVNERNERLIEGLLVLAESDRGLPGTVPVRLDELVDAVLDVHGDLAARHQVRLTRTLAERTVAGDPVLLERMIVNLVHNGIRYNRPDGTVDVIVADEPTLTVRNTGQSVPAEVIPSLFEPFRRLSDERTFQRDGAGLGLSIVRSIVAAHHGWIRATPGEPGGLVMLVHLP
ncbi:MAG TPA: HAMP domain-containing sensor histidine kinase [Pseudonocardiaceae bacterium]|nr:HAMP domain-containing sensor histidine kinase [Pseudonocardiaceae bacterium]